MTEPDSQAKPSALDQVEKGESLWVGAWHRLRKNKMALVGGTFILLLVGLSFIGPFFLEENYYTHQELDLKMKPPGEEYITFGQEWCSRAGAVLFLRIGRNRVPTI